MEIVLIIIALVVLDMLALRYGADSRKGIDRDPRLVERRVRASI
jgi:hypothetical protein